MIVIVRSLSSACIVSSTLSQIGSALACTYLSPFARYILGLIRHSRHFYYYILCDNCLHDLGLYIWKILTNREVVSFQKLDFLRLFFINCVTTAAKELNVARFP